MEAKPHNPATPTAAKPAGRHSVQVGQALLRRGVLTESQLEEARRHVLPLEQAVVELGFATQRDVLAAAAAAVGVPFVTLTPAQVQPDAARALPADFCAKHNVLPLMLADDWLTVAVEDFGNVFLLEEVKRLAGRQAQVVAASGANIRAVREQVVPQAGVSGGAAVVLDAAAAARSGDADGSAGGNGGTGGGDSGKSMVVEGSDEEFDDLTILPGDNKPAHPGAAGDVDEEEEPDARDLEAAASGSPIIRLVNRIVKTAVEARASDIHIEPEDKEFRIRYRIDGDLVPDRLRPPLRLLPAIVSRIKILAGMDISERRLPQDGGITAILSNRPIEMRVSTMATPLGEKACLRIVDNSAGQRRLEDLGLSPNVLTGFRRCVSQPNGIVLVTGPTGSGKTTTLYAALAEVADDKLNISSVEDPVEYHLKGINQFQTNVKAGFTFAKALRSLLRQDPDVIMIGEIRDAETAKLATEAALTGHLVLSTLHTNDAPSALPRLINMGVEPYLVAAAVRGVLAQRLIRRLCPYCRLERPLGEGIKRLIAESNGGNCPIASAFQGTGCGRCRNTGYAGRTGIHELLTTDEEMLTACGRDMHLNDVRRVASERGFTTLLQDTLEKIRAGLVGVESLFEVVGCPDVTDLYADEDPKPVAA